MKKIPSLFKRDYEVTRLVYDAVVPGCEWVLQGEGVATVKFDGTACLIHEGKLYKRYDCKLTKSANRRKKQDPINFRASQRDFKKPPPDWNPAQPPDFQTGHWPGWLPVGEAPEDQWHREAWRDFCGVKNPEDVVWQGTYELVGPKIQSNPYDLTKHTLWKHGVSRPWATDPPRTFRGLKNWLALHPTEGLVWWHPDGRMAKIKRSDFGYAWPVQKEEARDSSRVLE